jgi:hypothetical protein
MPSVGTILAPSREMERVVFTRRGLPPRRDVHGSGRSWDGAESRPLARVLGLARRIVLLNAILAVPVYFYVMCEFKLAGMW